MQRLVAYDGEILTPHSEVERKACPFYGFGVMRGTLVDQKGNRCALFIDSHAPCQMEYCGQRTDWNECEYNTPNLINILKGPIEDMTVFPREFSPEDRSWNGIRLTDWIQYIQKRD